MEGALGDVETGDTMTSDVAVPDATRQDWTGTYPNTLLETMGIAVVEASLERVVGTMTVTPRLHQPFGILHGGASVVLAESLASIGATVNLGGDGRRAVGLEINANHVRGVSAGVLTGTATPVHRGRTTQVWSIEIRDEDGKLVCLSRCTLAVLEQGPR